MKQTCTEIIGLFDKMIISDLKSFYNKKDGSFNWVVIMHSGSAAETGEKDCDTGKDTNGRIWSDATSADIYLTDTLKANKVYVASAFSLRTR